MPPGEYRFRLSTRVALLLGETPDDRKKIAKFIRRAYDARSGIVHGGDPGEKNLRALNGDVVSATDTGRVLWSDGSSRGVGTPTVANGVVYVPSGRDLFAVDGKTGEQIWGFRAGALTGEPAVAGGVVYFGDDPDGTVHALDASTGEQLWSFNTGGAVDAMPTVVNGVVYVGSADHKL